MAMIYVITSRPLRVDLFWGSVYPRIRCRNAVPAILIAYFKSAHRGSSIPVDSVPPSCMSTTSRKFMLCPEMPSPLFSFPVWKGWCNFRANWQAQNEPSINYENSVSLGSLLWGLLFSSGCLLTEECLCCHCGTWAQPAAADSIRLLMEGTIYRLATFCELISSTRLIPFYSRFSPFCWKVGNSYWLKKGLLFEFIGHFHMARQHEYHLTQKKGRGCSFFSTPYLPVPTC
jgi:hypothetical protein